MVRTNEEICFLSASETLRRFRAGTLTPTEHLEAMIARIEAVNPIVNALVDTYFEEARTAAAEATQRYAGNGPSPRALEGLTVVIKDETPIAGKRTTAGSELLSDDVSSIDSIVVERIREAGGIIHARGAASEFCVAPFTHTRLWGVTRNPWNLEMSPGGSSGGCAAALAAGMTALADGSDIGGSIRIPAAFCGLVGFKPPYGRVPADAPWNLDHYCHQGPLARTVEDAALLENVLAGHDHRDPVSIPQELTLVVDEDASVRGMRIAFSRTLGGWPIAREVQEGVDRAAAHFASLGAEVHELDDDELGWSYDRARRAVHAHFGTLFSKDVAVAVEQEVQRLTPYVPDFVAQLSDVEKGDFFDGFSIEAEMHAALAGVFERYDLLLAPTNGVLGFVAGEDYVGSGPDIDGDTSRHWIDVCPTQVFNVCSRNPVLTVPAGRLSNGVPLGVSVVGRLYDDQTVFTAAAAFTRGRDLYEEGSRPTLLA